MIKTKVCLVAATVFALSTLAVLPAQAQVTTLQGTLAPGVYGRIDIGNAPPPPLIYAQPMIIRQAPVYVEQRPLYLRVPPGHEKKWSKHCSKYNACGQPVYFVRDSGREEYRDRDRDRDYGRDDDYRGKKNKDKDKEKHRGKEHGNSGHDD